MTTEKNQLQGFDINQCDDGFKDEIRAISGENASLCMHCGTCTNGCPFSNLMDFFPNRVLRMVQMGLRDKALECGTIWVCVGCNTCSVQCPMAINIPAIMDSLCHIALAEGVKVAEPEILSFHQEFLNSVQKYGRSHKLEIMVRYKLRNKDWFGDMGVGIKLLGKRKLHFRPSRLKNPRHFKNVFERKQQETHDKQHA